MSVLSWVRSSGLWSVLAMVAVASDTGVAAAATASGHEVIRSYDVAIEIELDGDVRVTERIDYDFGDAERHGIFRTIPTRLRFDDRHDRLYPLADLVVTPPPGTPQQYEVEDGHATEAVRIGSPSTTVTGRHTYTISYTMRGVLNAFPGHDELYWNAVGAEWQAPVEQATVRVTAPAGITRVACFAGPLRSGLPCASAAATGPTAAFSHAGLNSYEALTVVVAVPPGVVSPAPRPILEERWTVQRAFSVTPWTVLGMLAVLIAVAVLLGRLLWRQGRDRRWAGSHVEAVYGNDIGLEQRVPLLERTPAPMELAPPDGLRPGLVGTVVDEAVHPLDVTATIVDLAVRGYLRIEELPKKGWFGKADWRLIRLRTDTTDLHEYERLLFEGLFEGEHDGRVELSELKNTFRGRFNKVTTALYDDVVQRGWFRTRPDRVRLLWRVVGVVALVLSLFALAVTAAATRAGLVALPLPLGALVLLVGAGRMPHRTPKGTAVLRRVQGFRRFIEESDRERIRWAEQKHLFEEYLPYAVVFGATEKWAKAFAGLEGEEAARWAPSWYVGGDGFSMARFGEAMDGFAVTTAGSLVSTPSSSGGSGFGGGGFSGGGAGGGGGGSW